MAPHGEESNAAGEAAVVASEQRRPVSTILIVMAMQTEAMPVVNKFQLKEDLDSLFPPGVPWVRYCGVYKDLHINLVWCGKDPALGVDSIGTVSASLVTYAAIQALKPDLIINAGTAGGFKAKGASIGDVFLVSDVAFHDRRIPIPVFDLYGVGLRQGLSTPNLLKELNLKIGKLSTGDSLDMSPHDEEAIIANDATVKDMERSRSSTLIEVGGNEIKRAQHQKPTYSAKTSTEELKEPSTPIFHGMSSINTDIVAVIMTYTTSTEERIA